MGDYKKINSLAQEFLLLIYDRGSFDDVDGGRRMPSAVMD